MQEKKAIIIGSGVAGMAAAIRLAVEGFAVFVYEKNNYPGGKVAAFDKEGYHFDTGPSLFTQPQNIEELFELAGEPISDYFRYRPVDISCTYFYENGKVIPAYADAAKFEEVLVTQLNENPGSCGNYLKRSGKLYDGLGSVFLNHSLHKRKTWLHKRMGKAIAAIRYHYLFRSLHQYNRSRFRSPETVQLFNRFATYNGSSPYKAPAMLSVIPHLEQNQGAFYPEGGMVSISKALYELAKKKGVQFYLGKGVDRIIYTEGKVRGVVVDGENIEADTVICNADVCFTYSKLLRNPPKTKKLLKQEPSSSAVIFYWGINKQFNNLGLHNVFFSNDYRKEFDHIFMGKWISEDPTVYVNVTAKMESAHAPAGKENWFVMVNVPANHGQPWELLKQQLRVNIIAKLNRILGEDIEPLIETEQVSDPLLIEQQTGSWKGSLYGASSNSKLAAFFRAPNFTPAIKGLYFCGGSVHPGGGIPLCLKSAKIVSELVKAAH